jgi:hypothetical protein
MLKLFLADAEIKRHRPRGHDVSCPYGAGAPPPSPVFVSVDSTEFNVYVSYLESTLTENLPGAAFKGLRSALSLSTKGSQTEVCAT